MDETSDHIPTPNISISGLYQACQESVLKYCQDRTNNTNSLIKILASAFDLYRFSKATQEAEAELKQLMKDKGIRTTKRTANYFTPIVKLIFDGEVREKEKSLVMRCASTLRLADSMNIEPDGIGGFVDEQGGIVECYKLDREMHAPAAVDSTKHDPIEALRQNAQKYGLERLQDLVPDGLAAALLEVNHDGKIALLGAWSATQSDIRRYKISTKSAAA
jgi:hypothetical protein